MTYINGEIIRQLREKKKYTQKDLAERLSVSDKAVSKWETGRGLPDIGILPELAAALSVSVAELLTGEITGNRNRSANMKRSRFYVCPICGNIIHAMGEGSFSCCGVLLPPLEEEPEDEGHRILVEPVEDELYVRLEHPMDRGHSISFLAYVSDRRLQLEKLYPEGDSGTRFRRTGSGRIYACCSRHGLFSVKI